MLVTYMLMTYMLVGDVCDGEKGDVKASRESLLARGSRITAAKDPV